jgi:tetratricopeptide (TPR) repeat protein
MTEKRILLLIPVLIIVLAVQPIYAENTILQQYSLALQKESQGNCLDAIFIYRDILKQNRYFLDAKLGLARCYLKTGNLTLSEKTLLDAIKQDKKNVDALSLLGRVYTSMKRYDEAEKLFLQAIEIEPMRYETKYRLADLYRAEGNYEKAITLYSEILKVYPQEVQTYIYLGIVYTELGELEKAGGYYRKAVSLDAQNPLTHINLARHYYRMGVYKSVPDPRASSEYFDAAVYEANTALSIAANQPEAHDILASVYFYKKEYDEAMKQYLLLPNWDKDDLILYSLGFCAEALGDLKKAVRYYEQALRTRIDDEVVRFRLEKSILRLYRENLSEPERISLSDYHFSKAQFYLDRNIMNKAFIHYKRAVILDPLNPSKRLALADFYRMNKYYEQYLYELKTIIHDTLDVDTVDIRDRIEIYESRVSKNLASQWGVDQYGRSGNQDKEIPSTKTRVVVLDGFHSDYIKENFLHKRLSLTIRDALSFVLSYYPKIQVIGADVSAKDKKGSMSDEIETPAQALRTARSLNADYYITGSIEETRDSLRVDAVLVSGLNGKIVKEFTVYYTGNDRVFNAVISLADDINGAIPLYGTIVRLKGDRALINLGRAHGVQKDAVFHIFHQGGLRKNPETGEFEVNPEVPLGELTITKVDEMISEGTYTFTGLFNRVNVYDSVLFKGMKEDLKAEGKKE